MTVKYVAQTLNRAVVSHSMLLAYDLTTVMPEQYLVLCTDVETSCGAERHLMIITTMGDSEAAGLLASVRRTGQDICD